MKAFLMYRDQDFELEQKLPSNAQALVQNLDLNTLFYCMASGDKFLFDVAKVAVLSSLTDLDIIGYRQNILKDCLKNPFIVRDIYDIAVEAIKNEKKNYLSFFNDYPAGILDRSIEVMQMFVAMLKRLKRIADEQAGEFESEGFTTFFAMLRQELDEEYFATIENHLKKLKFNNGILVSAELGKGNKGTNYILRKPNQTNQSWLQEIFGPKPPAYTVYIPERDESGAQTLSQLRDRGISLVARALAQSADHILSFLSMLRTELGFYVSCLNLQTKLIQKGEPIAFPLPEAAGQRCFAVRGLYDVCLSLRLEQRVVGNDVKADRKDLGLITGANQGGKSTFLRAVGLSQLMMQCGMFVPAEAFGANVCDGLFTHYKREEDAAMNSGKLDEELGRMSEIVDDLRANSMLLFNESFAATNEREGSEIAAQIVWALLEKHVKVFFVTHLYEFAHGLYSQKREKSIFLRAERQPAGERTFKIIEGEPLQTSYGEDLYKKIFGTVS